MSAQHRRECEVHSRKGAAHDEEGCAQPDRVRAHAAHERAEDLTEVETGEVDAGCSSSLGVELACGVHDQCGGRHPQETARQSECPPRHGEDEEELDPAVRSYETHRKKIPDRKRTAAAVAP